MTPTTFTFEVKVLDGECLPVADLEVGARFRYGSAATTWSRAITDGDGYAHFRDAHPEPPTEFCVFVGDQWCDTFRAIESGVPYVLEL